MVLQRRELGCLRSLDLHLAACLKRRLKVPAVNCV
jgi:hypothetical protein